MPVQIRNDQMVGLLSSDFVPWKDPGTNSARLLSMHQRIPAVRGLWGFGGMDNSGNMADSSGNGHTMSLNGNPLVKLQSTFPYYEFDGTGDFFSVTDAAAIEVSGTESFIDSGSRGMTCGAIVSTDSLAANQGILAKWNANTSNRSWMLYVSSSGVFRFNVSNDGSATALASTAAPSTATWYYLVGRFVPSTSVDVYLNGVKTSNTTSIPASIFDASVNLRIGRYTEAAGTFADLDGRVALAWYTPFALPDGYIQYLYQSVRWMLPPA